MKKLISAALALVILLCAAPITVFAYSEPAESVFIGGIELKNDTVLLSGESKAVSIDEIPSDFDPAKTGFAYFTDGNLMLSNFRYEGESEMGALIYSEGSLFVIMNGVNSLKDSGNGETAGIMAFGELIFGGTGSLNITAYMGVVVTALGAQSATYVQNGGSLNITLTDEQSVGISVCDFEQDAFFYLNGGKISIDSKAENGSVAGIACFALNEYMCASAVVDGGELYIRNTAGGIAIAGANGAVYQQTYGHVDIDVLSGEAIATVSGDIEGENSGGVIRISGGYIEAYTESEECDVFSGTVNVADTMETYGTTNGYSIEFYEKPYVVLGGVKMQDGDYLASGATKVSKTAPASGGYAHYREGKLTLNSYEYDGDGGEYIYGRGSGYDMPSNAMLYSYSDLEIEFIGENSLKARSLDTEGIAVYGKLDISGDTKTDKLDISALTGIQVMSFGFSYLHSNAILEIGKGIINIDSEIGILVTDGDPSSYASAEFGGCELNIDSEYNAVSVSSENVSTVYIINTELTVNSGYTGLDVTGTTTDVDIIGADVKINSYYTGISAVNGNIYELEFEPGNVDISESRVDITVSSYSEEEGFVPIIGNIYLDMGMNVISGSLESKRVVIGSGDAAFTLGDVNNDGVINQYDYILVKRHHFETRTLTETEFVRADVNKDGNVNQYDYLLVARHYFGTYVIE